MLQEDIMHGESKVLEFKQTIDGHSNLIKTICAFANRNGGKLVIGIDDSGEPIGLDYEILEQYLEKLPNIIRDSISPMILPEIYTYDIECKTVLVIEIYPGQVTPYHIKSAGRLKGTYIRVGRTNKLADEEMIASLERKRMNIGYDMDIHAEADDSVFSGLRDILGRELKQNITDENLLTLGLIKKVDRSII